jgi:hypothetical protein
MTLNCERELVDCRPVVAWDCDQRDHCYSSGAVNDRAAMTMPHALEVLVGQFDWVQRSLPFNHVRLEQGPNSYIYPSAGHVRQAINPTHSTRKSIPLDFSIGQR